MTAAAALSLMLACVAVGVALFVLKKEFPEERMWRHLPPQAAAIATVIVVAHLTGADARQTATLIAVASLAAAIAVVDVRRLLVPDLLVVALALVAAVATPVAPGSQLAGAAILAALFLATRWFHFWARGVEGLGLGDVKLAAAIGLLVGPLAGLQATAGAAIVAAAWAIGAGAPKDAKTPFGAALAAALVVAMLFSAGSIA